MRQLVQELSSRLASDAGELTSTEVDRLEEALRAYRARRVANKRTNLDTSRISPSQPKLTREVHATVSSLGPEARTSKEAFLDQEPWSFFQNEVVLEEFRGLSEQDRREIARLASLLVKDTFVFQVTSGKAVGAQVRQYSHDYHRADIKEASDPNFSWDGWARYLNQILDRGERRIFQRDSRDKNVFSIFRTEHSQQQGIALFQAKLRIPAGTTYVDDRPGSHESILFLREGAFLQELSRPEGARLRPFVYQCAAMQINPQMRAYFDASFAGRSPAFINKAHPLVLVSSSPTRHEVVTVEDTGNKAIPAKRLVYDSSAAFVSAADQAMGTDSFSSDKPIEFWAGSKKGVAYPRVVRGDRNYVAK